MDHQALFLPLALRFSVPGGIGECRGVTSLVVHTPVRGHALGVSPSWGAGAKRLWCQVRIPSYGVHIMRDTWVD